MLTDRSSEVTSTNSQTSVPKSEKSANIQTTEIVYNETPAQTIETRTVETQTITDEKKKPQVDYSKLADFLKKVTPGVFEALDEAYGTNAFNDYDSKLNEDTVETPQLLQKISTVNDPDQQVKVSDISWGTSGGTLAVSHGVAYHETWCDHLSKIQLYHRAKDSFTNVPSKILETNACVTTLSYHPSEPSILAAGLFNGDIVLWNMRNDVSLSPMVVCTHGDSVSQVSWKTAKNSNNVSLLVSSSKDGYIFIHKLLANFTTARPHKLFKVAKNHNPIENSRPQSAGGTHERAIESGLCVTAFDFSSKDNATFVVGTFCGGIYKCRLDRAVPIEGDEAVMDPVVDEYMRHAEGGITAVKCSPTRNLFVTAATDGEIRIYDFEEHACLHSFPVENTVVGLTWMIGNEDVFATYGAGPNIRLYNVTNATVVSNINFDAVGRENATSLRVNSNRDLAAIGDTQGNVEIWRIPRQLL